MIETTFITISNFYDQFIHGIGVWVATHGLDIVIILVLAQLTRKFGKQFLTKILEKTARPDLYPTKSDRAKRLRTIENLASDILNIAVNIIAVLMIINELGVDTTPLLASAGAIGVVFGIGAQSLVRDVTSGFFIIVGNQYRVGDDIQLRVGGAMSTIEGTVEDIGMRSTTIRELNGNLHHVPNGNINTATNKTIGFSRINLDIVFPATVDVEKIKLIVDRIGQELAEDPHFEKRIKDAPKFIRVCGFDKGNIKVKILGKVGSVSKYEVEGEFYARLIKELKKAKIKLPEASS